MASDFFGQGVISNSYENTKLQRKYGRNGFISYAARLSYNYGQRYYIQASVRREMDYLHCLQQTSMVHSLAFVRMDSF